MASRFDHQIAVTTMSLLKVSGKTLRVFQVETLQPKNLCNSALYLIRQVITAYEYDSALKAGDLKDAVRSEQQAAINHFNGAIAELNQKRADWYEARNAWIFKL